MGVSTIGWHFLFNPLSWRAPYFCIDMGVGKEYLNESGVFVGEEYLYGGFDTGEIKYELNLFSLLPIEFAN